MQVLWFVDETACAAAAEMINANLRAVAVEQGYDLDEDGCIIGKDNEGNSQPTAQVTTSWDVPHHDPETDAWWLSDPAMRYTAEEKERLMQGVVDYTEGEYFYPVDPE